MLRNYILIFLGGGAGSIFRFWLSDILKKTSYHGFPAGTFAVNILGCFMIGVFLSLWQKNAEPLRLFLAVGFCGGFTTFSTFSAENLALLQNGNYFMLMTYILLSVFLGLMAVWLGFKMAEI